MAFKLEYDSIVCYTSQNITGDGLPVTDIGYYNSVPNPSATLQFIDTNLSSTSQQQLQITNSGTAPISIVGINLNPITAEFNILDTNFVVDPNEQKFARFTFNPTISADKYPPDKMNSEGLSPVI